MGIKLLGVDFRISASNTMSLGYRINRPKKEPAPAPPARTSKPITRRKRKNLTSNEVYLAVRDIYLENNPTCDYPDCELPANQIHHICRGVFRAASLLNTNTFLGACGTEHHDLIERMPIVEQIRLKQKSVRETIDRLRR